MDREVVVQALAALREQAAMAASPAEAFEVIRRTNELSRAYRVANGVGMAPSPIAQARELDPAYVQRPHLRYLSDRILAAVEGVERGENRRLVVSMPPRAGKSTLVSQYTPLWMLRRNPNWKIVMTSYDPGLTLEWTRNVRTLIEDRPSLDVRLARDAGAGGRWYTRERGGMYATNIGGPLTGRGARVLVVDDPISDFVAAHSARYRDSLWNWWLSVAQTRLEPPFLVLVVMTRWHEDDFVGRLLSPEYEGNPADWEQVALPAIAGPDDVMGRAEGEPLLSPLLEETPEQATARWATVKEEVGTYVFSAMYQQRPSPQKGAIFDTGWWRFWTTNPARVTDDGMVAYLDPGQMLAGARWVDSWDCSFKGGDSGSWVVGQRWARLGANRYLVAQKRGRWSFTATLDQMKQWVGGEDPVTNPYGRFVHRRLVEDAANGPAIIDVMRETVAGIKPVRPHSSKEARARAVTPEIESGHVYLPHPKDPGNEWVADLLSELRNFPNDMNDDQVDALTQALTDLREVGRGGVTVPGRVAPPRVGTVTQAAVTDLNRRRMAR